MVCFLILDLSAGLDEEVLDLVLLFKFFREVNFFVEVDHLLKIIVKEYLSANNTPKSR